VLASEQRRGARSVRGVRYVNTARVVDPGLAYDIKPTNYITHLCTLRYMDEEMFKITHAG
jgi:hypothetical protein